MVRHKEKTKTLTPYPLLPRLFHSFIPTPLPPPCSKWHGGGCGQSIAAPLSSFLLMFWCGSFPWVEVPQDKLAAWALHRLQFLQGGHVHLLHHMVPHGLQRGYLLCLGLLHRLQGKLLQHHLLPLLPLPPWCLQGCFSHFCLTPVSPGQSFALS